MGQVEFAKWRGSKTVVCPLLQMVPYYTLADAILDRIGMIIHAPSSLRNLGTSM